MTRPFHLKFNCDPTQTQFNEFREAGVELRTQCKEERERSPLDKALGCLYFVQTRLFLGESLFQDWSPKNPGGEFPDCVALPQPNLSVSSYNTEMLPPEIYKNTNHLLLDITKDVKIEGPLYAFTSHPGRLRPPSGEGFPETMTINFPAQAPKHLRVISSRASTHQIFNFSKPDELIEVRCDNDSGVVRQVTFSGLGPKCALVNLGCSHLVTRPINVTCR